MLYLFYGDDDLARTEYVRGLLARVEDPMGDLNQTRLAADRLTFGELRHACDSMPFLSDRRIVIVEGLLAKIVKRGPKDFGEQLRAYIPQLPDYTRLFLLENEVDRRTALWKGLAAMAAEKPPRVFLKEFALPKEQELPEWIQQRARHHGGLIDRRTAMELATFVGQNVRVLDQEIRKLVTYAGDQPVTSEAVRLLVPYVQEATVWELVDGIGARDAKKALGVAQRILSDDPSKAIYLHVMITRQIRMLLQVAELVSLGHKQPEIQRQLGMNSFVLGKIMQQARNFSVERLEQAFDHLLDADVAMKSGADQVLTLNLLIVELAGRRAA
jgi:DNA polymerase III subunit delta